MTPEDLTAKHLLAEKASKELVTTRTDATVQQACRLMHERRIGCLVVTDGAGHIEGIFTGRDVVSRVVAEARDAAGTTVGEVMTREVIIVEPGRKLDEIEAIMKQHRVRHLPVAGENALLGLISIGDVLASHAAANKQMVHYLTEYIYGRH